MSKLVRMLPFVAFLVLFAQTAFAGAQLDDVTDVVIVPAVPEPTAALVMGAGLVAIAAGRRLRRR
jgi:hypothetical protein